MIILRRLTQFEMYNKYLEKNIKLKTHIKNLVFKYNVFYILIFKNIKYFFILFNINKLKL